jgi:hypothetical protein
MVTVSRGAYSVRPRFFLFFASAELTFLSHRQPLRGSSPRSQPLRRPAVRASRCLVPQQSGKVRRSSRLSTQVDEGAFSRFFSTPASVRADLSSRQTDWELFAAGTATNEGTRDLFSDLIVDYLKAGKVDAAFPECVLPLFPSSSYIRALLAVHDQEKLIILLYFLPLSPAPPAASFFLAPLPFAPSLTLKQPLRNPQRRLPWPRRPRLAHLLHFPSRRRRAFLAPCAGKGGGKEAVQRGVWREVMIGARKKEKGGRGEEAPCSYRCSCFLSVFSYPQCYDCSRPTCLPCRADDSSLENGFKRKASKEQRKGYKHGYCFGKTVEKHTDLILLLLRWRSARLQHPLRIRDWVSMEDEKE